VLLCLKTKTELASETLCFFKKLYDGQSPHLPKKKIVSLNFSHAVSSLLEFLTLEDETDRMSQNIGKE